MSNVLRLNGVTLPGTGYPTLKSFLDPKPYLPVTTGLLGLYYLRESPGGETTNFAGGPKLTKVGAPQLLENGAVCSPGNYYDTGIQAHPLGTILAIAVPTSEPTSLLTSAPVMTNYTPGAYGNGDILYFGTKYDQAGHVLSAAFSNTDGGTSPTPGSPNTTPVYLDATDPGTEPWAVFGTFIGNGHAVGRLKAGALDKVVRNSVPYTRPAAPFGPTLRIGASPSGAGFQGQSKVILAAYFNRILTDAEILKNLNYLRNEWGVMQGVW